MNNTLSHIVPIDDAFYGKALDGPVRILAHGVVSDAAVLEAGRRVRHLLAGCPAVRSNLSDAGAELHIIGCDQAVTDLPMYRHMAGKPFDGDRTMDERGRGYGGLHACCAEESLLGLPSARHRDHRDVTSHELAHTVLSYGLDRALRLHVEERYHAALDAHLWGTAYATTNAHEFFAELTMWFVGSRGDYGDIAPSPRAGRAWLARYDPRSEALLHQIYSGELAPEPVRWERLEPSRQRCSGAGNQTTVIVFHNRTAEPLRLSWLDYQGRAQDFGWVHAGGLRSQDTYVSHPWVLTNAAGEQRGPFVAVESPGTVVLHTSITACDHRGARPA